MAREEPTTALPMAGAATGYYGRPLLKKPVWTWEIPLYFFVGGAAGAAALIAEVARWTGSSRRLVRDAQRLAAVGGLLSPVLLISDLGRPARFLYMLRVFKPQSPMSVGVWIVLVFSNAAAGAAVISFAPHRVRASLPVRFVGRGLSAAAAITGLGMCTYTGVLIGVTAIPAWAQHVRLLPLHFAYSGVATAVSILQLLGHRQRGLHRLGLAAALVETGVGLLLETTGDRVPGPLRHGRSGMLMRTAGLLAGPVPLGLRLLHAIPVAAAVSIAGALLTRFAWVLAGQVSSQDPAPALSLQGAGPASTGSGASRRAAMTTS
jgi:formate-dependent nitrite reductase membrane component NrfD